MNSRLCDIDDISDTRLSSRAAVLFVTTVRLVQIKCHIQDWQDVLYINYLSFSIEYNHNYFPVLFCV